MAVSAESVVKGWSSRKLRHDADDLKGVPANVREAILDVEKHSHGIAERVALAEELHGIDPDNELALEPGTHAQTTWAQRFEEVGGEIVEVVKESHDSPVRLVYRPDLRAAAKADPASALQARLAGQ